MPDDEKTPGELRWRWDESVPLRWLLVDEYTMGEPDTAIAACADIDGLFVDVPPGPSADGVGCPDVFEESVLRPAMLLGCRPEPPLRRALDALARGAGNPGGALWRRRILASVFSVADDGTATSVGASLQASVADVRPSVLGDGLLDVAFDAAIADPIPAEARQIWELWRAGRPAEPGGWARYDRETRLQWASAALFHHPRDTPDKPSGTVYHLDGRDVTDIEGFYCAIGEAVNGPGGYFGWNLGALHDCTLGGWGAARPFKLVWHDFAVARSRWVSVSVPDAEVLDITVDQVLQWLAEDGVEVVSR
ncbi:barstar family protein [Actinocorallia populi]|uniref:barstar family protein n=1 Tax=Actinocorallia populi TaxID=2079200 RepID=UPI001E617151|nr:barstar family protein [Actinocorallia populi]